MHSSRVIDNVRGEACRRQWIIFDGDVDPEWVENLNSVLDDNKLLTLPNGERLAIPPNVRIMFEVQDLKHATLATVSRCGMVWFSEDVLTTEMIFENFLLDIKMHPVSEDAEEEVAQVAKSSTAATPADGTAQEVAVSPTIACQREMAAIFEPFFASDGLIIQCLEYAASLEHIMDFTRLRALTSLFSILKQNMRNVIAYNHAHTDFPMQAEQMESYLSKSLVTAVVWAMSGDGRLKIREDLGNYIRSITHVMLPPNESLPIIDFEVSIQGEQNI